MNRKLILVLTLLLITAIAVVVVMWLLGRPKGANTPSSPLSDSVLPTVLPGRSGFSQNTTIIGGSTSTQSTAVVTLPRLRHITLAPTAGAAVILRQVDVIENRIKTTKDAYYVRYMERASGHIYELNIADKDAVKITNTTVPKVYEASFTPDGNSVIARFLSDDSDTILTYHLALRDKPSATTTEKATIANEKLVNEARLKDVVGTYLPSNILEAAVSSKGSLLLSLTNNNGSGVFTSSTLSGTGSKTVLTHPLREWLVSLPTDTTAVVTTKPSSIANGYAYRLSLGSGSMQKIIGGIAGLTLLPRSDLKTYLGGATPGQSIKLFKITSEDGTPKVLPLSTLPEKCVWSHKNIDEAYCAVPIAITPASYPDSWYQGRVFFTDQIWKINVATEETSLISNLPQESGQAIDATNLSLSSDDAYLVFTNKVDLTLWGLDLKV